MNTRAPIPKSGNHGELGHISHPAPQVRSKEDRYNWDVLPAVQRHELARVSALPPQISSIIQPKLQVGPANDRYEQEADRSLAAPEMPIPDGGGVQRVEAPRPGEEEELVQGQFTAGSERALQKQKQPRPNLTGLPDQLKGGVESLSGLSMDDIRVHYNSPKPAELEALAYARGREIHVGPGQERHLPHEAWHVVQQAQGRVKPTTQSKDGVPVNNDRGLEHEADVMGAKALQQTSEGLQKHVPSTAFRPMLQRMRDRLMRDEGRAPTAAEIATTRAAAIENSQRLTGHGRPRHGKQAETPSRKRGQQARTNVRTAIDEAIQLKREDQAARPAPPIQRVGGGKVKAMDGKSEKEIANVTTEPAVKADKVKVPLKVSFTDATTEPLELHVSHKRHLVESYTGQQNATADNAQNTIANVTESEFLAGFESYSGQVADRIGAQGTDYKPSDPANALDTPVQVPFHSDNGHYGASIHCFPIAGTKAVTLGKAEFKGFKDVTRLLSITDWRTASTTVAEGRKAWNDSLADGWKGTLLTPAQHLRIEQVLATAKDEIAKALAADRAAKAAAGKAAAAAKAAAGTASGSQPALPPAPDSSTK